MGSHWDHSWFVRGEGVEGCWIRDVAVIITVVVSRVRTARKRVFILGVLLLFAMGF